MSKLLNTIMLVVGIATTAMAVVPTPVFEYPTQAVQVARPGSGMNANWTFCIANTQRTIPMTCVTPVAGYYSAVDQINSVLAVDTARNWILCQKTDNHTLLGVTFDGTSTWDYAAKVVDLAGAGFPSASFMTGHDIKAIEYIPTCDRWIVAVGTDGPFDGSTVHNRVYLCKNPAAAETSSNWIELPTAVMYYGFVNHFAIYGNKVVCGEYGTNAGANGCGVWLCEDISVDTPTFTKIGAFGADDAGHHVHQSTFYDADTIYVACGEAKPLLVKMTRPVSGTTWDTQYGGRACTHTSPTVYKNKLYCGTDFPAPYASVMKYNLDTVENTGAPAFITPLYIAARTPDDTIKTGAYDYTHICEVSQSNFDAVAAYDNVLYAGCYSYTHGGVSYYASEPTTRNIYTDHVPHGGLYATTDGNNWTAVIRDETHKNYHMLRGVYTCPTGKKFLVSDTYTIPTYYYEETVGEHSAGANDGKAKIYLIEQPTIRSNTAVMVEKGYTNKVCVPGTSVDDYSSWEVGDPAGSLKYYHWTPAVGTMVASTDYAIYGTKSAKWAPTAGETSVSNWGVLSTYFINNSLLPPQNYLFSYSFWYKGTPNAAIDGKWIVRPGPTSVGSGVYSFPCSTYVPSGAGQPYVSNYSISNSPSMNYVVSEAWNKAIVTGYNTGASYSDNYTCLDFKYDRVTGNWPAPTLTDVAIYTDAMCMIYDTDRWRSYSHRYFPTYTSAGGIFQGDYIIVPMTTATSYSLSFEWQPMEGWANFYNMSLPICSVVGTKGSGSDAQYYDLYWKSSDQKIYLTDQSNNGATAIISTAVKFNHYDTIKVLICSNVTGTAVYIHNPSTGTISGTNTAKLINSAIPIYAKLGAWHDDSNIGCGAYTNIRVFNVKFTAAADVATIFKAVSPLKPTTITSW